MTAFTVPSLIKNAPLIGVVRQSYHEGNHGDSRAFSLAHAMRAAAPLFGSDSVSGRRCKFGKAL